MPIVSGQDPQAVLDAGRALARGELVAFPTETVYGLGARADDDAAVARIYAAKGRPAGHPLIVHVLDAAAVTQFSSDFNPMATALAQAFWPGPLTVIVPRRSGVATAAAGGHATIGLRCPAHPVAAAVLAAAARQGVPGVAAPSANRFGRVSATCAAHVAQEFGPALWVVDGGDCALGIESTIVDCTRSQPVLLRPGLITRPEIERVLGQALMAADAGAAKAPGTLAAHYAPLARVRLMSAQQLSTALGLLGREAGALKLGVYSRTITQAPAAVSLRPMPLDAAAVAHELFAVLRDFDDSGVQLIWIETPPAGAEWEGVCDRLQRAAAA